MSKLFKEEEKLVRLRDFIDEIPVSRSTFLNGVKEKIYPQPVRLNKRVVAWKLGEIKKLMQDGI